ncbi:MAG: dihydrofolate reductase [Paludibacteraceae bacterium]|nr:dihydrofolate reductase [Paludibacteraceae bacterium]
MLSIIVAIDENYAIGKNGDLLCHLPADLKHFKEITTGQTVLMGSKTYLSLPRRPLPNRKNIVITSHVGKRFEGATSTVYTINGLRKKVKSNENGFVIGGGTIYKALFPYVDKLYVTHIHHKWDDADTFFPQIDSTIWKQISAERHAADEKNPYDYTFEEYIRK